MKYSRVGGLDIDYQKGQYFQIDTDSKGHQDKSRSLTKVNSLLAFLQISVFFGYTALTIAIF